MICRDLAQILHTKWANKRMKQQRSSLEQWKEEKKKIVEKKGETVQTSINTYLDGREVGGMAWSTAWDMTETNVFCIGADVVALNISTQINIINIERWQLYFCFVFFSSVDAVFDKPILHCIEMVETSEFQQRTCIIPHSRNRSKLNYSLFV